METQESERVVDDYWRTLLHRVTKNKQPKYGIIELGKYLEATYDTLISMTGWPVNPKDSRDWHSLGKIISGEKKLDDETMSGKQYTPIVQASARLKSAYVTLQHVYQNYRNPLAHNNPLFNEIDDEEYQSEVQNVKVAMKKIMHALSLAGGSASLDRFHQLFVEISEQAKPEKLADLLLLELNPTHSLHEEIGPVLYTYLCKMLGCDAQANDLITHWNKRQNSPYMLWATSLKMIATRCHSGIEPLCELVHECVASAELNDLMKQKLKQWLKQYSSLKPPKMSEIPTIGVRIDRDQEEGVLRLVSIKLIEPYLDHFDKVNNKLSQTLPIISEPNDLFDFLGKGIEKYLKARRDLSLDQSKILLFIFLPDLEAAKIPWHMSARHHQKLENRYRCITFSHCDTHTRRKWSKPIEVQENIKLVSAHQVKASDFDEFEGLVFTEIYQNQDLFKRLLSQFGHSYIGLFGQMINHREIFDHRMLTPELLYRSVKNLRCQVGTEAEYTKEIYLLLNTESSDQLEDNHDIFGLNF